MHTQYHGTVNKNVYFSTSSSTFVQLYRYYSTVSVVQYSTFCTITLYCKSSAAWGKTKNIDPMCSSNHQLKNLNQLQNIHSIFRMTDFLFIARKNVWLRSIANTCQCILGISNDNINFEFFLRLNRALITKGIEQNQDLHEEFMHSREYQCVPSYTVLCKTFFRLFFKMTEVSSIRILYKCMYAIRNYDGCEFVVDSFDLKEFQEIGFDSDRYFEKFPEFNKANHHVMYFGSSYKNAYKWTTHWDDDHKYDADV